MDNTNENKNLVAEEKNSSQEVVLSADNKQISKNKQMFLYGFGALIFIVLVVIGIFGFVRVRAGATDGFAYYSAKFMRLPLASVNGQKIAYVDYLDDMKAIWTMKNYEEQNNGGVAMELTQEQMSDQVVWRLANNLMISQVAKNLNIKIEKKDIEDLKKQVLEQFESEDELEKELIKRYGWNMQAYEAKVIRPFVLQSKVSDMVQTDQVALSEIRQKAQDVLEQIKNGANFEEMAGLYGEDGTRETGGDLGWFGKGEMIPQFEAAAFNLKKGELAQELVETEFGFHVLKVYDTKTERVKNESGTWVNEPKVKASHILFMYPSFEKYMDSYLKKAEIKFYSKIHNPFEMSVEQTIITE